MRGLLLVLMLTGGADAGVDGWRLYEEADHPGKHVFINDGQRRYVEEIGTADGYSALRWREVGPCEFGLAPPNALNFVQCRAARPECLIRNEERAALIREINRERNEEGRPLTDRDSGWDDGMTLATVLISRRMEKDCP